MEEKLNETVESTPVTEEQVVPTEQTEPVAEVPTEPVEPEVTQ